MGNGKKKAKVVNGTYVVSFDESDCEEFSSKWPCSTVEGHGWFEFADNGDLVDMQILIYDAATEKQESVEREGHDWNTFRLDMQATENAKHAKEHGWEPDTSSDESDCSDSEPSSMDATSTSLYDAAGDGPGYDLGEDDPFDDPN